MKEQRIEKREVNCNNLLSCSIKLRLDENDL